MNTNRIKSTAVGLVGVALVVLVAGCASAGIHGEAQPPVQAAVGASKEKVIATGTLTGVAPSSNVVGTISIAENQKNHTLQLELNGFSASLKGESDLELLANTVTPGSVCSPPGQTFSAGSIGANKNQTFPLPNETTAGWSDPSYFKYAILTTSGDPSADCTLRLDAYAELKWTGVGSVPAIHVADQGARTGAEGTVAISGGKPVSYTVVSDDNLTAIATRFGLTLDQLLYLNPPSGTSVDSSIDVGQKLNLSLAHR